MSQLRIAVDIGGTFTDLAAFDQQTGRLSFGKALSTHDALVEGIEHTAQGAGVAFADARLFLHGSTIVINTLLERTGAKTALLITEGFRDIYEIGRVNRPDAYNLFFTKHEPLTPRSLRFEVRERMRADGSVHRSLEEARVHAVAEELKARGVQAVAILLLHAYRAPAHEQRVKALIREVLPQVFVSASYELSQEYREFERASTVVANAYVGPRVAAYLGELEEHLAARGFRGDCYIVQSTGGLFPVAEARVECIRMLESGPAAGVIGTQAICAELGLSDAIAFDMGGTTAKAGVVVGGRALTTGSAYIGGYEQALPIQTPMIDIFEVGTGGGSIARVSTGGALRVGPQSAGSEPGPACYGQGGNDPTITDANLLLGRIDPEYFLGGQMRLHRAAAERVMAERVAGPLRLDLVQAAAGVVNIAVATMVYAVKGVTTERGLDAGRFTMVVYGGAGPLHASALARGLGIRTVIIPFSPGHFSAYGMLFSDLRHDYVRSIFRKLASASFEEIEAAYAAMEEDGRAALARSPVAPEAVRLIRGADMRYVGQEHAVTVELPPEVFERQERDAIKAAFDAEHLARYGTCAPNEAVDLVSLRVAALGIMRKPPSRSLETGRPPEPRAVKPVFFRETGFTDSPVYRREELPADFELVGPALVEEHASTTVVQPGDGLRVDRRGNLVLTIGSELR